MFGLCGAGLIWKRRRAPARFATLRHGDSRNHLLSFYSSWFKKRCHRAGAPPSFPSFVVSVILDMENLLHVLVGEVTEDHPIRKPNGMFAGADVIANDAVNQLIGFGHFFGGHGAGPEELINRLSVFG